MTTRQQSWQRVTELFEQALEHAPEKRAAFLKSACAGDSDLLREVESLLAEHEAEASFMESPAVEAVAKEIAGVKNTYPSASSLGTTASTPCWVAAEWGRFILAHAVMDSSNSRWPSSY